MTRLLELIESMPPDLQQKVEDYARSLLPFRRPSPPPQGKLTDGWAGGLRDLGKSVGSVELQHQILKERERMAMGSVSQSPPSRQ